MNEDPVRRLRHDIRGQLNALKLCVAALDTPIEADEAVEFLDDISRLCDTTGYLLDDLERLLPQTSSQGSSK